MEIGGSTYGSTWKSMETDGSEHGSSWKSKEVVGSEYGSPWKSKGKKTWKLVEVGGVGGSCWKLMINVQVYANLWELVEVMEVGGRLLWKSYEATGSL